jgi:hypothetical protein
VQKIFHEEKDPLPFHFDETWGVSDVTDQRMPPHLNSDGKPSLNLFSSMLQKKTIYSLPNQHLAEHM